MGPILINPGGPGASGNEDVLGFGEDLYDLLDGAISITQVRGRTNSILLLEFEDDMMSLVLTVLHFLVVPLTIADKVRDSARGQYDPPSSKLPTYPC